MSWCRLRLFRVLIALLVALPACLSPQTKKAPPLPAPLPQQTLVLLTIDSVRVEHLGAYGYARATTPHFDRLAGRGALFRRAYAQAPHTSFSLSSLLTGRYFAPLRRLLPTLRIPTLADELEARGWATAAIYPPAVFVTDPHVLAAYKADHFGFRHVRSDYISADQSVDEAIRFFEQTRPQRALVWIHVFEPHEPYQGGGNPSFGTTAIDRYDQELVVVDATLGRLAHYLQAQRPETTWVISADHGEAFHEHGESLHGTNLHEEQIRVPLLIVGPGIEPRVIEDPVQLIDVLPTLLARSGARFPFELDGRDLSPLLQGQALPARPAFASLGEQHMIVDGGWKRVWDRSTDRGPLYNLQADPDERRDLAHTQAARADRLRSQLQDWLSDRKDSAERLLAQHGQPRPADAILRARLGDPLSADPLIDLIADATQSALHDEASRLLLRLPLSPRLRPRLLVLLSHRDPTVAARGHIAALRSGRLASLSSVLRSAQQVQAELDLRLAAALALAPSRPAQAVPVLLDLMDRFEARADYRKVREILLGLGPLRDRRALPALRRRLKNPMVQLDVMAVLGQLAAPAAAPDLIEHLRHDERVPARIAAAQALGHIRSRLARAALQRAAQSDPESSVRSVAATLRGSAR
jgi:arylsulfatase A-like enzyme